MNDCIFCKMIKGEIPCHKVYEDDDVLSFLDINPSAPGHTMIIPKGHVRTFLDLPDEKVGKFFLVVKKIARQIKDKLGADGLSVGANVDEAAGQVVQHLHVHIIPRWQDDAGTGIQSVVKNPPTESLEEMLEKIKM